MKTLAVPFEVLIGEAVGVAVMNGVSAKEIATELRRIADVTEQRGVEMKQQIDAMTSQGHQPPPPPAQSGVVPTAEDADV